MDNAITTEAYDSQVRAPMSDLVAETTERPVNVEEHARIVMTVLKEYVDKLAAFNAEVLDTLCDLGESQTVRRAAWLLDQGELMRAQLPRILSRGSGLLEHSKLTPITQDELALRMREIEIHIHHALRMTHELRKTIEEDKKLGEQVAKLRVAAGLNGMRGGPLRPE
jgi:hypothetical protein